MNRRRFAIVAVSVLASLGGTAVAGNALPGPTAAIEPGATGGENTHGDWWCVHTDTLELTYCQGDPLPERLPLPDRPAL